MPVDPRCTQQSPIRKARFPRQPATWTHLHCQLLQCQPGSEPLLLLLLFILSWLRYAAQQTLRIREEGKKARELELPSMQKPVLF